MADEYDFKTQEQKGWQAEQHFFNHLLAYNQKPVFNKPDGNNQEYDILANGIKYEVKSDFYANDVFPIEYIHLRTHDVYKLGWLHKTHSDYIIFYKSLLNSRYWLKTKTLKQYIKDNLTHLEIRKPTKNKDMLTINFYLTEQQLSSADIVKRIETY